MRLRKFLRVIARELQLAELLSVHETADHVQRALLLRDDLLQVGSNLQQLPVRLRDGLARKNEWIVR
jgi:hypothetical protein